MIVGTACIEKARSSLLDTSEGAYRWEDSILLVYLNQALEDLFVFRPDLGVTPEGDYDIDLTFADASTSIDLPSRYIEALSHGIVARALEIDSSDTANAALSERFFQRAKAASFK